MHTKNKILKKGEVKKNEIIVEDRRKGKEGGNQSDCGCLARFGW
jgi:hypothetical protein